VPPYTSSPTTISSPLAASWAIAAVAAEPLENAIPWRPFSSAATARSSRSRVGLMLLA
jgi:hypothetical protein